MRRTLDQLLALAVPSISDPVAQAAQSPDAAGRPTIIVQSQQMRDEITAVIRALEARNTPPVLFVREGRATQVWRDHDQRPVLEAMSEDAMRLEMAQAANFLNRRGQPVYPPGSVARAVIAHRALPFPSIVGVVSSPVLRADGTLVMVPGYDPQTRLLYAPAKELEALSVPDKPTPQDAQAAVTVLDTVFGEFPFVSAADKANHLSYLLSPIIRPAIDGYMPMMLVKKPMARTGAGLLCDASALIVTGRFINTLVPPARDGDDEWRKRITSSLLQSPQMVCVDNIEADLRSPVLASVLTRPVWDDRMLGRNLEVHLPHRVAWSATGNNPPIGGDLPLRIYPVRLDARTAHPERRTFRINDLPLYIMGHRAQLLGAALTLVRAWIVAERPEPPEPIPVFGGFDPWAQMLGGMLAYAGVRDFLGNLHEAHETMGADAGADEWHGFLLAWSDHSSLGARSVTTAEVNAAINDSKNPALRIALPAELAEARALSPQTFTSKLGHTFRRQVNVQHGDDGDAVRLERGVPDRHQKQDRWKVVRAPGKR
jgi:hypothetical protein